MQQFDLHSALKATLITFATCVGKTAAADPSLSDFSARLIAGAKHQTLQSVQYDGSYRSIPYPNGDVPADRGVCTDVIVRAYRQVGIDLQKQVHEDMQQAFSHYPSQRIWGLTSPDTNIDHRRVPNLQVFFTRHGTSLPVTANPSDYRPGDLVTWMLPGNLPHIGIVIDEGSASGRRPLVVHNIGQGTVVEDMLFKYPITGHYRYPKQANMPTGLPSN